MSRIFVSYRRKDASGHAGRLFDRLCQHFGAKHVFRDVDDLKAGDDFVEALARAVDSADVFILVIGRDWADARDAQGKRRLDDPHDFIRLELEAAFKRKSLILPVLVEGAPMVEADSLPEPLRPLARRQAIELSEHRWDFDVQELLRRIDEVIGPQRSGWKTVALRATAAVAVASLLVVAGLNFRFESLGIGRNPPKQDTPATSSSTQSNPGAIAPPPKRDRPAADKTAESPSTDPAHRPEVKTAASEKPRKPEETVPPDAAPAPPARPEPEKPVGATGVSVPDVMGKEVRDAAQTLKTLGLGIRAEYNSGGRAAPGTVSGQRPRPGTMVRPGEMVQLSVVESLRPNEHAAGRVYLSLNGRLNLDQENEGPEGWDIRFDRTPSDTLSLFFGGMARGAWLRVGAGNPIPSDASACERVTPSLTTVSIEDRVSGQALCVRTTAGRTALIQLGRLTVDPPELAVRYSTLASRPTTDSPANRPADAPNTPPGTTTAGSIRVPQLVGQQARSASETLNKLGVRIKIDSTSTGRAAPGTVFNQSPVANTLVDRGALVQLYVETELGPNEHAAGRFSRSPNAVIQLDRDEPDIRGGWDFAFRGTAATGFSLEFANGALAALVRRSAAESRSFDPAACRGLRLSPGRIPLVEPIAGQIVCVKTTRGRTAIVYLGRLTPEPPELFIRYSTLER